MGERKAVTKHLAKSYPAGDRATKGRILDEVVELTGWHRDHAPAALRHALDPPLPRPVRAGRAPTYGVDLQVGMTGQRPRTNAPPPIQALSRMPAIRMNAQYKTIKPAALSRQVLALNGQLETISTAKRPAPVKPAINDQWNHHDSQRFT